MFFTETPTLRMRHFDSQRLEAHSPCASHPRSTRSFTALPKDSLGAVARFARKATDGMHPGSGLLTWLALGLTCLAWLASGCSSTGTHAVIRGGDKRDVSRAIFLDPVPSDVASARTRLTTLVEGFGFRLTTDRTSDCLVLQVQFDPDPWHRVVSIGLLESEKLLVFSQSVNPGWGNWIASGVATANLEESALAKFHNELSQWMQGVSLREPRPVAASPKPAQGTKGSGTGFYITGDGLVLTANHVIEGASRILIKATNGTQVVAHVRKVDKQNDLAILETGQRIATFVQLASARSLTLGQSVYTLGYPFTAMLGESVKFTGGQISALSGIQDSQSLMQITVPVQPGNSGGPLFDESGKVVGVITSTAGLRFFLANTGALPQNVNWAVKSDYAMPLLDGPLPPPENPTSDKSILARAVCLIVTE